MQKIFSVLMVLSLFVLVGCGNKVAPNDEQNNVVVSETAGETVEEEMANIQNVKDLPSGDYQADIAKSRIGWFSTKLISNAHPGVIDIKSGILTMRDGVLSGGQFVVDMPTMRDIDNNEKLIQHIKSADFFDVTQYPESKFVITSAKLFSNHKNGSATYVIIGDLTIKDRSNPVEFQATLTASDNELSGKAKFSIDRTQWGLTYGSGQFFKEMGDKAIKDNIDFEIDLTTRI